MTIVSVPNRRSKLEVLRSKRFLARGTYVLEPGTTRVLRMRLSTRDQRLLRRVGRIRVHAYLFTTYSARRSGARRVSGTLSARTSRPG